MSQERSGRARPARARRRHGVGHALLGPRTLPCGSAPPSFRHAGRRFLPPRWPGRRLGGSRQVGLGLWLPWIRCDDGRRCGRSRSPRAGPGDRRRGRRRRSVAVSARRSALGCRPRSRREPLLSPAESRGRRDCGRDAQRKTCDPASPRPRLAAPASGTPGTTSVRPGLATRLHQRPVQT